MIIASPKNLSPFIPKYGLSKSDSNEIVDRINLYQAQHLNTSKVDLMKRYLVIIREHIHSATNQYFPASYANKEMVRRLNLLLGVGPDGISIFTVARHSKKLVSNFVVISRV